MKYKEHLWDTKEKKKYLKGVLKCFVKGGRSILDVPRCSYGRSVIYQG